MSIGVKKFLNVRLQTAGSGIVYSRTLFSNADINDANSRDALLERALQNNIDIEDSISKSLLSNGVYSRTLQSNVEASDSITINLSYVPAMASRTSGVGPLLVHFDAVGTSGIVQPPLEGGRREYADYLYTWGFGDVSAGNWAISGKAKNMAYGHMAAHLFEYDRGSTYVVTLNVTDGVSINENYFCIITVTDPDVYYLGSTFCFAHDGDFTDAPSSADLITTSSWLDVTTCFGTDNRILLKRGNTWVTSAAHNFSGTTTLLTIGAFGVGSYAGTEQNSLGIYDNAPKLISGNDNSIFTGNGLIDWRLMDLDISQVGSLGGVTYTFNTSHERHLILRNIVTGFNTPWGMGHWDTEGHDQIGYVENFTYESGNYIVFTGAERLMLLGNVFRDSAYTHCVRCWQAYHSLIQHNEQSGATYATTRQRHALKLHGPYSFYSVDSSSILDNPGVGDDLLHRTEYVIVSDILVGDSGPWPVSIGPQDALHKEDLNDILVENMRIYPGYGSQSPGADVQWAIEINARYCTIRNNIITSDGSSASIFSGVEIWNRGWELPPLGIRVYHNTFYVPAAKSGGAYGVVTDSATNDTEVINNLIQGTGTYAMLNDGGWGTVSSGNIETGDAKFVDATNSDYLLKDFSLAGSDSPAFNAGQDLPSVFLDFNYNTRPNNTSYDSGAFELGAF